MSERDVESLGMFIGKTVTITRLDDQVTISTDDGWSLHIYSSVGLLGNHSGDALPRSIRLELNGITIDEDVLTLAFGDGSALHVDLSDGGYSGPEAMQLNGPDGSITVWN